MIAEPPLDAPDEDWLVWADAMQQIGDPRGELIALASRPDKRDTFAKLHGEALLGPALGRHFRKGRCRVTRWRRYLADEIELRVADAGEGPQLVVDALKALPHLRGLAIAGVGKVDLTATLGWLRESRLPPSLTSLALVDDRARAVDHLVSRWFDPEPNLVTFGPLYEVWRAFAHLERLTMIVADPGQIQFQSLRLPNLRSFTLHSLCWAEGLGDMFVNAHWPKLASLELRVPDSFIQNNPDDARAYTPVYTVEREREPVGGTARDPAWQPELERLFATLHALPLERLALTSWENPHLIDMLYDLPASLVELDFSDSAFDRAEAELLVDNNLVLQLRRLVLERVRLPSPQIFDGLGIEIVHSCAPSAPTYRFVIGME